MATVYYLRLFNDLYLIKSQLQYIFIKNIYIYKAIIYNISFLSSIIIFEFLQN